MSNLTRRILTGLISGRLPVEMESFNLQLEEVAVKDVLDVTEQTHQHYQRMLPKITQVHRKKRCFKKADDPTIIDSLYEFLFENSNIVTVNSRFYVLWPYYVIITFNE